MIEAFTFCPRCGHSMIEEEASDDSGRGSRRRVCSDAGCGFVQRTNPTPAVGALEAGEEPAAAVEREVKEELNLDAQAVAPRDLICCGGLDESPRPSR